MIGLKRGTVKLVPYEPIWTQEFKEEKKRLTTILGDLVVDIQHIGSTSIPGISAKPIIDIDVGVKSSGDFPKCMEILERNGYEFRKNGSRVNSYMLFAKGPQNNRTHYIHVVKFNGEMWKHDLLFRDFLSKHRKEAMQYEDLKNDLEKRFADDRGSYTKNKKEFIRKIIQLAKKETYG